MSVGGANPGPPRQGSAGDVGEGQATKTPSVSDPAAGGTSGSDATTTSATAAASVLPAADAGRSSAAVVEVPRAQSQTKALLFGSRALAAGSKGRRRAAGSGGDAPSGERGVSLSGTAGSSGVAKYAPPASGIAAGSKYLVVGDGIIAPFMALALRVHGLECDLAHHKTTSDVDRGTIVLTPSITQVMGDVLNVSVPSGSVVGRILSFDHVGNDMCDIDLNEFREKGESPTFFSCDRPKIENSMLSLCNLGTHSCNVLTNPNIDRGGMEALDNGNVLVRFASGLAQEYKGIICTSRNQSLVPELTLTNEELQDRAANNEVYKEAFAKSTRWLEVCTPPLPELGRFEKRFTPGSQEIVEILTPREGKMIVRPTMMATKLFYNVSITIPDEAPDPRLKSTSLKQFWDEVVMFWTAGIPGYVSHTMFRPMFSHMQNHFTRTSSLVYRTPRFVLPNWVEGGGRLIKIGHAAHGSNFDSIDVSDSEAFADCFGLARCLASGSDVRAHLAERKLQVMEEMDHHALLQHYSVKERGQMAYMYSRFMMKIMRRYKNTWRKILKGHVSMMPKALLK